MSINRCSTLCECGLINLMGVQGSLPDSVLTYPLKGAAEKLIHHGYGYREDLVGDTDWWVEENPETKSITYTQCRTPNATYQYTYRYIDVPKDRRYLFYPITCPFCQRKYWGWYVREHDVMTFAIRHEAYFRQGKYQLYDTCYFHSVNDEPNEEDADRIIHLTLEDLLNAIAQYLGERAHLL